MCTLTDAQLKEVQDFWKPYEFAYQNDSKQQAFFTAYSGKFDLSYSGFGTHRFLLHQLWNSHPSATLIGQKCFTPLFFHGVKMAEIYIMKIGDEFLDGDRNVISLDDAAALLVAKVSRSSAGEAIIKLSGGGEGRNISFINKNTAMAEIFNVLNNIKGDFICEQVIRNHVSFAELNPKSLNTLRMVTLNWKGKIHYCGAALRMGTGKRMDNWSAGGVACGVNADGSLNKYAFYEDGRLLDKHPVTGVVFENHKLYRFPEAVTLVKKLHAQVSQLKHICWDVTVDEWGDLVLVEVNALGTFELTQMGTGMNGYANKDIAKEIFDTYLIERFFYDKAIFDWNYREFVDHISLRKYCGMDEEVTVPREIDGKPVWILYDDAVTDNRVRKLIVPRSVRVYPRAYSKIAKTCTVVYVD